MHLGAILSKHVTSKCDDERVYPGSAFYTLRACYERLKRWMRGPSRQSCKGSENQYTAVPGLWHSLPERELSTPLSLSSPLEQSLCRMLRGLLTAVLSELATIQAPCTAVRPCVTDAASAAPLGHRYDNCTSHNLLV